MYENLFKNFHIRGQINAKQRSKMDLCLQNNPPNRTHPLYLLQASLYAQVHLFLHWYPYVVSSHGSEQLTP